MEGSLAEAQAKNARLSRELLQKSESFEQKRKSLQSKYEAEAAENTKLQQSLKELRNICLDFGSRCVQRLKKIFNSVGASAEKFTPSAENISSTFEHIEGEVVALDEVIAGHDDFCALLASHGTTAAFLKVGCTHAKIVNRPNFSLSPSDLVDIPTKARSIGSRFITRFGRRVVESWLVTRPEACLSRYDTYTCCLLSCNYFLPYTALLCTG
jgi:hypothetical protein